MIHRHHLSDELKRNLFFCRSCQMTDWNYDELILGQRGYALKSCWTGVRKSLRRYAKANKSVSFRINYNIRHLLLLRASERNSHPPLALARAELLTYEIPAKIYGALFGELSLTNAHALRENMERTSTRQRKRKICPKCNQNLSHSAYVRHQSPMVCSEKSEAKKSACLQTSEAISTLSRPCAKPSSTLPSCFTDTLPAITSDSDSAAGSDDELERDNVEVMSEEEMDMISEVDAHTELGDTCQENDSKMNHLCKEIPREFLAKWIQFLQGHSFKLLQIKYHYSSGFSVVLQNFGAWYYIVVTFSESYTSMGKQNNKFN